MSTHAKLFEHRTRCGATRWSQSSWRFTEKGEEPTCRRCLLILAREAERLVCEEREQTDKIAGSFGG